MKKFFLILLALTLLPLTTLDAKTDGLPKWAKEGKLKADEIIGRGLDANSAMIDALQQIYDRLPNAVDSTSLLSFLQQTDSTLSIDQRNDWIEKVVPLQPLVIADSAVVDSTLWVLVKAEPEQIEQMQQHLQDSLLSEARVQRLRALDSQSQGDLLKAANEYAGALKLIVPLMHQPILPDSTFTSDFGQMLFNEYISLFDSIRFVAQRKEMPVVGGEEIPLDVTFQVLSGNRPVIHFPVKAQMKEGELSAPEQTDEKGLVTVHIKQAPAGESDLCLTPAENIAVLTANVYGRSLLAKKLNQGLDSAKTHLLPFDPTPAFAIQMDSIDALHHDSIAVVLTRAGMVEVPSVEEADLLCQVVCQNERSQEEKHGDYMLAVTHCSLKILLTERLSGNVVATYEIPNLDFTHPAKRSEEAVRLRTMELLMRTASSNLPTVITKETYDKRKAVYSRVK